MTREQKLQMLVDLLDEQVRELEELLGELFEYVCKIEGVYGGQTVVRGHLPKLDEMHPDVVGLGQRVRAALWKPELSPADQPTYRGDRFRLPSADSADRTARILIKPRRPESA